MLTKHQIQDYNKNGFIIIEELLTKDEINKTHGLIDQFIEDSREIKESDNIFDLEEDHSKDNPRLTRVKQPHLINIHFLNLIKNSLKISRFICSSPSSLNLIELALILSKSLSLC